MLYRISKNAVRFGVMSICLSLLTLGTGCNDDEMDGERVRVYIDSNAFNPTTVNIPKGGTVIWENDDTTTHTVTHDGELFDSGDMAPDETYSHKFDEVGTFNYHCKHHSGMTGNVIVQ